MALNVNRVVLTGNLTQAPELVEPEGGTARCRLRIAVNGRRKDGEGWQDRPNYVSVTVWGAQALNCGRFLEKGRAVAVDGRLEWHEWSDGEGRRREALEVVGETVQFLGARPAPAAQPSAPAETPPAAAASQPAEPALAAAALAPAPSGDVPF